MGRPEVRVSGKASRLKERHATLLEERNQSPCRAYLLVRSRGSETGWSPSATDRASAGYSSGERHLGVRVSRHQLWSPSGLRATAANTP